MGGQLYSINPYCPENESSVINGGTPCGDEPHDEPCSLLYPEQHGGACARDDQRWWIAGVLLVSPDDETRPARERRERAEYPDGRGKRLMLNVKEQYDHPHSQPTELPTLSLYVVGLATVDLHEEKIKSEKDEKPREENKSPYRHVFQ